MDISDIARRAARAIFDDNSHYNCEDCWYSCPKSFDGCCDDSQGDECNCGLEQKREKAATIIQASLDEYGNSVRCAHETAANS
jgi:hypothetical protein